jgi:hypothetical protein
MVALKPLQSWADEWALHADDGTGESSHTITHQ